MNSSKLLLNKRFGSTVAVTSSLSVRGDFLGKRWIYSQIPLNYHPELPKDARVVIVGSGLVGNSVAYNLIANGWSDICVIEKESHIGKGTSFFGSGTIAVLRPVAERQIISKSISLYKKLTAQGHDIGLDICGSLYLAQNRERMVLFKRRVAFNQPLGLKCKVLDPGQLTDYHPYINTNGLQGGVFVEEDATADPQALCHTLAKLSEAGGAKYVKDCQFKRLNVEKGKVASVETSLGRIQCEYFVNCAGMWAWDIGQNSNPKVRVPVHPAEHFYLFTKEVEGLPESLPTIRDYDSHTYIRKYDGNSFLLGGFEEKAKPIFTHGIPKVWRESLSIDWDHFAPLLERMLNRMPILKGCQLDKLVNAPDNFTPDGKWVLGETPEIDNYFVACGMNGGSLQGAGGIGNSLAHWIIHGYPDTPLIDFDVRRFVDVHNNRRFLYECTKEVVGRQYSILFPLQSEHKYARRVRSSPLYSTLRSQGAIYGSRMCFERPLYFDKDFKIGDPLPRMPEGTYWKPRFFDSLKEEYNACKSSVALVDMSSFSKFLIKSAQGEALEYLQRISSNDINVPNNTLIATGMHNEAGGYENDCMLARLDENSFFLLSPTNMQTRIMEWMTRHLPDDNRVQINDITSMYTVLHIIGPKSKDLLSELTDEDMNLKPFTYKIVNMGYACDVMVMWFTNTGEPGYSLYVPSEYAVHVYEQLMKYGKNYGIRNVGYLTVRFLRIEKFIPFWGEEIDSQCTPMEIGRSHRVKFDKDYFIGKFALQKQFEKGVYRRCVHLTLDEEHDEDIDVWPWGQEPIFRNGKYIGVTTSGGYGFTLNRCVCLGFIRNPDPVTNELLPVTNEYVMAKDAEYQINIAGRLFTVKINIHPPKIPSFYQSEKQYHPTLRDPKSILQAK